MNNPAWWNDLGHFWDRSTGGRDVAANLNPADHSSWPTAQRAAGVDAAVEWLRDGLDQSEIPRFLFLVGGPGAGKSHAAASAVEDLVAIDPPSALASRKYNYAQGQSRLVVINDATISSDEFAESPLANELDLAVRDQCHFMACVNRGILVEEAASLRRAERDSQASAGAAIVKWLQLRVGELTAGPAQKGWAIEPVGGEQPYLRGGRLFSGDSEVAHIVAVYVDVNSLFEQAPSVSFEFGSDLEVSATPYRVAGFAERMQGAAIRSPAGELIAEVISGLSPDETLGLIDPFIANVHSLKGKSVQQGLASILRAAEIVSSQRMTYREVWGAVSRCIIGGVYARCNADGLQRFILDMQPVDGDSPAVRFTKIRDLAEFRFSQSLFGAAEPNRDVHRDPVLKMTHHVDPVRDSLPGRLDDDRDLGWSSVVSDSFSGGAGNDSPLGSLLTSANTNSNFLAVVTDFDRTLDASYSALAEADISDRERHEATTWYGGYLTRLYAISNGIPAFRREVETWTSAWRLSKNLPNELEEQLTTLLKPVRYPEKPGGAPLFPIFESRTNPVRGDQSIVKLAIRSEIGKITSKTDSDSIFVEIALSGLEPTRMLLDFAMVREALACAHGHAGATELSDTTSPRLERFRSVRLVPRSDFDVSDYRVVRATDDVTLSVEIRP